jgi:hypothetical protein
MNNFQCSGSWVIPRIARRNWADISDFRTQDFVPLQYMFDMNHFHRELHAHCPQLVLRDRESMDSLGNLASYNLRPVSDMAIETARTSEYWEVIMSNPGPQFPAAFDDWLNKERPDSGPPSPSQPVHVKLDPTQVMWSWPTTDGSSELIRELGGLLRVRSDVWHLAARLLWKLHTRFGVNLPRTKVSGPTVLDPTNAASLVGMHFRVESDVTDRSWASYEVQSRHLFGRLDSDLMGIPALYVASGDRDAVKRLSEDLSSKHPNVTVVTKHDVLANSSYYDELKALPWDVQALVDLLVLTEGAAHMLGVRESSFSWYVALHRAAEKNEIVGGYPDECWRWTKDGRLIRLGCESDLGADEAWRDQWSTLVGEKGGILQPSYVRTVIP